MSMKILLLGKNGQLGWELQRSLALLGELHALGRGENLGLCGDLSNLEGLALTVRQIRPDVIVNAAAYTAVDRAESESELAYTINADAPAVLAKEVRDLGALLVHYSTDYVFDGSGDASRSEIDPTLPISVYGCSKLKGEREILKSGCRSLIFRTSWMHAAKGENFAKTILRLAKEREKLTVINDQWGAPTSAELLADISAHAIRQVHGFQQAGGIYHAVASGCTSWYEYAEYVIAQAREIRPELSFQVSEIVPVPSSAFPTPAKRPHNSRLSTKKLQSTFNLKLPSWQQGVTRMLHEIL